MVVIDIAEDSSRLQLVTFVICWNSTDNMNDVCQVMMSVMKQVAKVTTNMYMHDLYTTIQVM